MARLITVLDSNLWTLPCSVSRFVLEMMGMLTGSRYCRSSLSRSSISPRDDATVRAFPTISTFGTALGFEGFDPFSRDMPFALVRASSHDSSSSRELRRWQRALLPEDDGGVPSRIFLEAGKYVDSIVARQKPARSCF